MSPAKVERITGHPVTPHGGTAYSVFCACGSPAMRIEVSSRHERTRASMMHVLLGAILDHHRKIVRDRAGHKCEECGERKPLEVDHVIPRRMGGGTRDDRTSNLMVLCTRCHEAKHQGKLGKGHATTGIRV